MPLEPSEQHLYAVVGALATDLQTRDLWFLVAKVVWPIICDQVLEEAAKTFEQEAGRQPNIEGTYTAAVREIYPWAAGELRKMKGT